MTGMVAAILNLAILFINSPSPDNVYSEFCGVSGWYLSDGIQFRDTDWYILTMGPLGTIDITVDALYATYIEFEH